MELIDGKAISLTLREELRIEVEEMVKGGHRPPHLAVILVGENPASQAYVGAKVKACEKAGFKSSSLHFEPTISQDDLLKAIQTLNDDDELDDLPPLEESDLLNLDIEEPLDNVDFGETAQQDDFFDKFTEDELSPLNFAGKQIVIFYTNKEQAELLKRYLSDRTGMEVECIGKKENLWRFMKIDPLDLIILETGTDGNTDAMKLMQQTKDQFPEVHFICLSGPVSLERRLQFINAGALDYLTRPLHLSTIAQSILVLFSRTDIYDIEEDFEDFESEPHDIPEEEPIVDSAEDIPDKKSGSSAKRVDDELDLADEIDLIDEDF